MRAVQTTALVFILTACTPRGEITLFPAAEGVGETQTVFVGTTRGSEPEDDRSYSFERSRETRYARFDVSIPPLRQPGEITWPEPGRIADPESQFLTTERRAYPEPAMFRDELARSVRDQPRGRREAVIFVHGFNSTFAEGLYRIAQLSEDLDLPGVALYYSWPSRANPLGYAYDRDSALFARDGFEDLLDQVVAAGAERIVIVAHSMGSALTMETIRQLAIGRKGRILDRIGGVILISPDLDVEVFHAQATRIGKLPQPFVIFTSRKDRALALSARLTGQKDRLGNLADLDAISDLEVTLLDVSAFSTGLGHFAVGDSPALLQIIGRIGQVDEAFSEDRTGRPGLLPGAVLTVQNATSIVLSPVTAIAGAAQ